ncbi:MAG TPA: NnrU family protein [Aestuariivirga sp.]|nr:NnrU family protein [Aestuariivirga sp.]
MGLLALAVLGFSLLHLIPAHGGLRERLRQRFGRRTFGLTYGLIATAALGLIVLGWRAAPFIPVYDPPAWGAHANLLFMLLAFLLFGQFLAGGSWRQGLRSPMALAVMIWATGHLLANGDAASLILFGGLGLYAAVHAGLARRSEGFSAPLSFGHNGFGLLVGLGLYGLMLHFHQALIGVPVPFFGG